MRKNTFEELCYQLDNCKIGCKNDKITCARTALYKQINGNKNEFLKIKAESRASNINDFSNTMLAMCGALIGFIGITIELLPDNDVIGSIICYLLLACYSIYCYSKPIKWTFVRRWREYIIVVLEEIEENKSYFK